jgi:hypothetical protein
MAIGLMLFGDNNYDMADGGLAHLLLHFANVIVGEVNQHPYRTGKPKIDYYTHPDDVRPISDMIMRSGISGYYAMQQNSAKGQTLMSQYYQVMNRTLWEEMNGNTKIEGRIYDKGITNEVNGSDGVA